MKGLLLTLPWWVASRVYRTSGPHEITWNGVGIHIKLVVMRRADRKQFADHLRSSIPSGDYSVVSGCDERTQQYLFLSHSPDYDASNVLAA